MRLSNRHLLIVGSSGAGKSTFEEKNLVEEAERGRSAIICIDPHVHSLAEGFFAHLCARQLQHRVLYDRLCDTDRVLQWDFLSPSRAQSSAERAGENDNRCRQFADILLRRRGSASLSATPGIEEWVLTALRLYIHQRQRRPLSDLLYAFNFEHPVFTSMIQGCDHDDVCHKLTTVRDSGQTPFKAAERLLEPVCNSPAFRFRTESPHFFDFDRHLDEKGILIIEGGAGDALSQNAMETMMGAIVQKTFHHLRKRQREFPHVTLVLEEANNANLIGESGHEIRALAELRKYGLGLHILTQFLDFPAGCTDGILTNCATRIYFQSPEPSTASRLGVDLGGSYKTPGKATRHYRDGSTFDVPKDIAHPYAEELRSLGVGECFVRQGHQTFRRKITPLPPCSKFPEDVQQTLLAGHLAVIKQRPEYHTPDQSVVTDDPPSESPDSPPSPPENDPFGIF